MEPLVLALSGDLGQDLGASKAFTSVWTRVATRLVFSRTYSFLAPFG